MLGPFSPEAEFDFEHFREVIPVAVRMLDNVLDVTEWPLEQQREEAMSKRRVGLGVTGAGNALTMLGLPYNSPEGRAMMARIAEELRNAAYWASVELAKEKGAFPLFDAEKYLQGSFVRRLPENLQEAIREHGIRNSHLVSFAPTGTISLAFADNCSSGIEPSFEWIYERKKTMPDGSLKPYIVQDHAYRVFLALRGEQEKLPASFVSANEISASDHLAMVAAVAPFVDSAISKTVNVPEEYPYKDFQSLYVDAWRQGVKGITTFRPNPQMAGILSTTSSKEEKPDFDETDGDRRIRLENVPKPALASLRWKKRPTQAGGNPSWTMMVTPRPGESFAVFVGHMENGTKQPFEVWVNGQEPPRGLGALAKSLSMDMRSEDRAWLQLKLESLGKTAGDYPFSLQLAADATVTVPSVVAGFAKVVEHRCQQLGAFADINETPMVDALMSKKEPKTGPNGTMSWTVDVFNPATGDDFVMGLKELLLPDGTRRPYSVWLAGHYPRALDGLCKSLSYDMRIIDPAWVGAKLRQLLDYAEPRGDFLARVPGGKKQSSYPSTVAYMAQLIIHRYSLLGVLDEAGYPMEEMGAFQRYGDNVKAFGPVRSVGAMEVQPGKLCPACGNHAVIKINGCDFCTACGAEGSCG